MSNLENNKLILVNKTKGKDIPLTDELRTRDIEILRAGGSLAFAKKQLEG